MFKYKNTPYLKYYHVCGIHSYTKVYCDACHWSDSINLIPEITKKLVPLGIQYEKENGSCNGFGSRSLFDLMMEHELDQLRDVPECSPEAGLVPCELVNFNGVKTASDFIDRMDRLLK